MASVDWAGEEDVRQHLLAVYIDKALATLEPSPSERATFWNVVEEALALLLAELAAESKPRFNSIFGVVPLIQNRTGEPGWNEIRIVPSVSRRRLGAMMDFTAYYALNARAMETGFWPLLDWMLTVTDLDKESMRPVLVNLDYQRSWYSENGFPRHRQSGIAPH